jgi:hypothetical protein
VSDDIDFHEADEPAINAVKYGRKIRRVAVPPLDFATRLSADRVHHEVGDFKRWVATALGMKKHSTGSG